MIDKHTREMSSRMGYWKLRIRTMEWANNERVSLLDVDGFGKATIRALHSQGLTGARLIMETPTDEILDLMRYEEIFQHKPVAARRIVEEWKEKIRRASRERSDEPLPPGWEPPSDTDN